MTTAHPKGPGELKRYSKMNIDVSQCRVFVTPSSKPFGTGFKYPESEAHSVAPTLYEPSSLTMQLPAQSSAFTPYENME